MKTERRVPRQFAALALALIAVAALGACSVANSDSLGGSGDSLRIVLPEEPPTLEACESSLTSTGVVVRSNITQPLIERDPDSGDLNPLLATSWKQASPKTWTFRMRPDVTFQDGTRFDAEDAAFSIDRAVNSDLGCNVDGYVFGDDPLGIKVEDPRTLAITTKTPDPILPLRLSFVEIVPTSTDTTHKVREPVGTGPYEVDQWDAGLRLSLRRYDGYWGDRPAYRNVEYTWRDEGTIRAAMITSDEADIATGLGPLDGAGDTAVTFPNNETVALRLDGREAPLDDIRVRRAINYAIDKNGIVDSLLTGIAETADELVPPGVVGYNAGLEDPDHELWPYDVDKARALIDEAEADGVPVDDEIKLVVRNELFPRVGEVAEVLQEELSEVGLNVSLTTVDTAQSLEYQLRPFVPDAGPVALIVQHGNQAGDAAFTVDQYMLSKGAQSTFGSDAFDAEIADAATTSGTARQQAYADVLQYQNDKIVQFAHIAHMRGMIGVSSRVSYRPNSDTTNELRLSDIEPAGE